MKINEKSAAIDNDFLCNISSMKKDQADFLRIVKLFFEDLGVYPAVHPLVYANEVMKGNAKIEQLLKYEVIGTPTLQDILSDDEGRTEYYKMMIKELYSKLTGTEIPVTDIFKEWKKGKSLGEVHSVTMCLVCGCGIFLSDDGDSKKLKGIVESQDVITRINVYSREDACKKLQGSAETRLSRSELRSLAHKAN